MDVELQYKLQILPLLLLHLNLVLQLRVIQYKILLSSTNYNKLNIPPSITTDIKDVEASNGGLLPSKLSDQLDRLNIIQSKIEILNPYKLNNHLFQPC